MSDQLIVSSKEYQLKSLIYLFLSIHKDNKLSSLLFKLKQLPNFDDIIVTDNINNTTSTLIDEISTYATNIINNNINGVNNITCINDKYNINDNINNNINNTTTCTTTSDVSTPLSVYCDGVFDLTHSGHFNAMRQAKSLGHRLVVGVNSDISCEKIKGSRPLMSEVERSEMVRGCRDAICRDE
eukprot:GHVR01171382.1.p2 GENE.GHVR01171382.1~~GHVR01171382.1.p2  ORF type:complete len:184 (-),score=55.42 GHVR01171382.1:604-1155(-)